MALATLSIDLVAKLAKFESDMGQAVRIAQKNADAMDRQFAKVNATIGAIGKTIGTAFAAAGIGGLGAFIGQTIDAIDALNDMSDATGATIEKLSSFENLLRSTRHAVDDGTSLLIKLNKNLTEADKNPEIAQALGAVGLSAKELRALDPVDALQKVAQALAGYADDGNKARLVQVLLGKEIAKAAPILKDLAEKGLDVATVTTEQAEAASKYNKQLSALQTNIGNVARDIVSALLPSLNQLAAYMAKSSKESKTWLDVMTEAAAFAASPALYLGGKIKDVFGGGADATGAGAGRGFVNPSDLTKPSVGELDFSKLTKQAGPTKADYQGAIRNAQEYYKQLFLQAEKAAYQEVELPAPKGFVGPLVDDTLQAALDLIKQTDTVKIRDLTASLAELLNLQAGGNGPAGVDEAIANVTAELKRIREPLDQADKALEQFTKNVQDSFGQSIVSALKGNFENIGQLWEDMLANMIAQALAADIGKFIFGDLLGGVGGTKGGSFLGKLFNFGSGRANGGPVNSGSLYPVLENGTPEVFHTRSGSYLMTGRDGGGVTPLRGGGAGGGATIINNVSSGVSRAEVLNLLNQAMRASQAQQKASDAAKGRF